MATKTAAYRYATRSINGNTAFELEKERNYVIPRESAAVPERVPEAEPEVRQACKAKASAKSGHAYGISAFTVVGFAMTVILIVLVLLAHVSYTAVTNETVKLQAQLTALDDQSRKLQIAYGQSFNIDKVEKYATQKLGMTKPTSDQVGYVVSSPQDKAVVLNSSNGEKNGVASVFAFLESLLSYFK